MKSPAELEEVLSRPSRELESDMADLPGDILILGAGGKMGPSLAKLAKRAAPKKTIWAASRFSDANQLDNLQNSGVQTLSGDLLNDDFLETLPDVANVIFMAGQKFGTTGKESYTWAMNAYLPGRVAIRFKDSRIVIFSTGNVYPLMPVDQKGASESTPADPVGEYAQSCLGRERVFEYFSAQNQTPVTIFRLNYALDLRYGILNEVARGVWDQKPIDLTMGYVNVIWQGDANQYALRSLKFCSAPPKILNATGPETVSIAWLAKEFGKHFNKQPTLVGKPASTALLSDSSQTLELMGQPGVSLDQMILWTVEWVRSEGEQLGKPTHFQERKGAF